MFRFLNAIGVIVLCSFLSACYQQDAVQQKFRQEAALENVAVRLAREVVKGGYQLLTTEELFQKQQHGFSGMIVDVRAKSSYEEGHIPGAKNFTFPKGVMMDESWDPRLMEGKSLSEFEAFLGRDKNRVLIFTCGRTRCERGHNGALWAVKLGYTRVFRHPGGIEAWMGKGYSLLK